MAKMSWEDLLDLDLRGRDLIEKDGGIIARGPLREVRVLNEGPNKDIELVREWVAVQSEEGWRLMKLANTDCRLAMDLVGLSSEGEVIHLHTQWGISYMILPLGDNIKQPKRLFWP